MPLDILLVLILRTLVEVAGFALLGQGVLALLSDKYREDNSFYRTLRIVASPAVRALRFMTRPLCRPRAGGPGSRRRCRGDRRLRRQRAEDEAGQRGKPELARRVSVGFGVGRHAARAAWRADPTLSGAALAVRFGRQARWGRAQIAAAYDAVGDAGAPAGNHRAADEARV